MALSLRCALLSVNLLRRSVVVVPTFSRYYNNKITWIHSSFKRSLLNIKPQHCIFPIRGLSSLPPHKIVNLPSLSPTMETGKVVSWSKEIGDQVSEGDLLAEIETDKATMGMESSEEGFLAKIIAPAGAKNIQIGAPLCIIVESKDSIPIFKDYIPESVSADAPPAKTEARPAQPSPPAAAPAPAPTAATMPQREQAPAKAPADRIFMSPLARRLAEESKINISTIGSGSGINSMIISTDLKRALPSAGADVSAAAAAAGSTTAFLDIPLSGMRATIAKRLTESKKTIPHFSLTTEVQVDELLKLREQFNTMLTRIADAAAKPDKISVNDILIKAMALACKSVPQCNSSWHGDFIRQYENVDVCVAVAIPDGLVTPIIFNADKKGVLGISSDVRALAAKARSNQLKPEEFQGGTITITNLGMFGVTSFSAIINPPQVCILTVGGAKEIVIPDANSASGFRKVTTVSVTLCCDHRVVDGAEGAKWLAEFKKLVQFPAHMLL